MTDIFVIVLVVSSIHFGQASLDIDKCHCKTASFEREGCFRDDARNSRLFRTLLLNERVTEMKNFGNHIMEWYQYLPGFICRCATEAKRQGFDVFGIEYYAECWADQMSELIKNEWPPHQFADNQDCVNMMLGACNSSDRYCNGKERTIMVYRIVDQCSINFNKIGCFKENPENPLLNVNIFTDRDPEKPNWSGKYINFPYWYEYLPGLLCRCAEEAQKKGWKMFAIRKWGECWSGPYAERSFYSSGFSYGCHNQCFHMCRSEDAACSGKISTNTIYGIVDDRSESGSGQQYDAISAE